MFYDDTFQNITEGSAFTEEAVLTIEDAEYKLKGFFCSGNYGEKKLDKGYSAYKTVKRQSFQMSALSLPATLTMADLGRQKLTVRGSDYIIREVLGNESGIIVLDLIHE